MKVSASILSIKDNIKENIQRLDRTNIDYLHLDIMDGIFVPAKTWDINTIKDIISNTNKPYDVHLMVDDVRSYIEAFASIRPEFITFHEECKEETMDMINLIKSKGIKVGLSIKPHTPIENIYEYLPFVDMVLVMSVEPGAGGQPFILSSVDRINKLKKYREDNALTYLIEVDGGINNTTIDMVRNVDIVVAGSYITNNNYEESVNILKG